jgi:hypothetical protein
MHSVTCANGGPDTQTGSDSVTEVSANRMQAVVKTFVVIESKNTCAKTEKKLRRTFPHRSVFKCGLSSRYKDTARTGGGGGRASCYTTTYSSLQCLSVLQRPSDFQTAVN